MVPETGIIMNNEMNDFSIPNSTNAFGFVPSPANFIRPGKRPLSSMSPLIIEFEGSRTLYAVLGGAGGSRIITAVVQGVWNLLDRGDQGLGGVVGAVGAARLHDQLVPNHVSIPVILSPSPFSAMEERSRASVLITAMMRNVDPSTRRF